MIATIVIYLFMGAACAIPFWMMNEDTEYKYRIPGLFMVLLGWPVVAIWVAIGRLPARRMVYCAWCGKDIGPAPKGEDLDIWRAHYLLECQEHPLAKRVKELEEKYEVKP